MSTLLKEDLLVIERLNTTLFENEEILEITRLGGLTNHTYRVKQQARDLVFRLPGDGTEEIIDRLNERISTMLASKLGLDTHIYYFDDTGLKVMDFLSDGVTMNADTLKEEDNIKRVANVFKGLHSCGEDTGVPFDVFKVANDYVTFSRKHNVALFDDYETVKMKVQMFYDQFKVKDLVPCHNDPLPENWVLDKGSMFLIDWEYAGMNDPLWDVADVSIEVGYDEKEDQLLLESYLGTKDYQTDYPRFVFNKMFIDYLWSLWGLTRIPFDDSMIDYANERYQRLKHNLEHLERIVL